MMKWIVFLMGLIVVSGFSQVFGVLVLGGLMFLWMFSSNVGLVESSWFVVPDTLSSLMCLLTILLWLLSVATLSSKFKSGGFMLLFYLLLLSVLCFFVFMSLLGLFIAFEVSLIPITLMILGWGNQAERIQAGLYLLFYTVFFSLPLFVVILMFLLKGENNILVSVQAGASGVLMVVFLMSFFVKLPVYLVHLWLPKAHVEAPMVGSMLLAGILLKMGGYGSYRVLMWGSSFFSKSFLWSIGLWGFMGGLFGSLACCVQEDLKSLIALASVGHMNFMLGGLFMNSIFSFSAFLVLMFVHGLVSSGLFMGGTWFYERFGSRLLVLVQGLLIFLPWSVFIFSLNVLANFAVPPFVSFVAEFLLVSSSWLWGWGMLVWISVMIFFSCYYSIYFLISLMHGKWISKGSFSQNKSSEWSLMILHVLPCVLVLFTASLIAFCPLGVWHMSLWFLSVSGQ